MTGFASSSPAGHDDATLARAAAAGDRSAFAEIYDRYADRLHDFCVGMLRDRDAAADCVQDVFVIAATKLVQLREPDRLRSWLYAIARSEVLAHIRARKREQLSEELPEMPSSEPDMATMAARTELADLIADASGGLSDRDRVVLELSYRQGLDGTELAGALGVTPGNANTLVERLRDTIARSLGALLLCRRVKADPDRCRELAGILGEWDGRLTPLLRKRVARHIDGCAVCEEERARMVSPATLLGATPVVIPAPGWLRDQTLDRAVIAGTGDLGRDATPSDVRNTVSGTGSGSWWPAADFDDQLTDYGVAPASERRSWFRARRGRLGAVLVVLGIGGAAAFASQPAYRVAPVDDSVPLTTAVTSTPTTTASIAERRAPSAGPSTVPPAVLTTTGAVVAPTPVTVPGPNEASATEAPNSVGEPVPSPRAPSTREPSTVAPTTAQPLPPARDEPSPGETEPETVIEPPSQEPTTTKKPAVDVPKVPPAEKGPDCGPSEPACNGGIPVFE